MSLTWPDEGPDEGGLDYQAFVANTADVSVVETLDGRCRYASPSCRRLFGWEPSALDRKRLDDFVHPDDLPAVKATRSALANNESVTARYRFRCRDGSYRWIEASSHLVEASGRMLVVSTLRDITERQEYESELQLRARTDPLTGVANRSVLMDRIEQGLRRLDRSSGGLAVLYLDLDRFKAINDSLGHLAGDEMLVAIAGRLDHHLRPADTLARLGGDEFVIVADSIPDRNAAIDLGERVAGAVRGGILVHNELLDCTLSIGVAWTADGHRGASELLHEADLALYRAKKGGRDRVEAFDDELRLNTDSRAAVEQLLRGAITDGRVVIEYQPIIDLRDNRMVGAEALVRIRAEDTHLLLPESFLDVAEEAGLLTELDERVLVDAVRRARTWQSVGMSPANVAVNLTARHLADGDFCDEVIELLEVAGLPPAGLHLEVTEPTLLAASHSAISTLRSLRTAGVQIGLDDFGIGYTSVAGLREFPLDYVKIDGKFIAELDTPSGRDFVSAVITLAHAFGLTAVAEAVETEEQRGILDDIACDRAQGYLFARPAAADAVGAMLRRGTC